MILVQTRPKKKNRMSVQVSSGFLALFGSSLNKIDCSTDSCRCKAVLDGIQSDNISSAQLDNVNSTAAGIML